MWNEFLLRWESLSNPGDWGDQITYEERGREEVFNEPKLDGAVGISHDAQNHD